MLRERGKDNVIRTIGTTGRDKSEDTSERRRLKRYHDGTKRYRQNRTFQNDERKFHQQVG